MTDPELQELIKRNPINPKYGVPVPCILICNITGKETKYTAPEYISDKIKTAGSLEKLLSSYVCRGANKDAKAATKPASTKTWQGENLVKADTPTDKEAVSGDTITHYYLNHESGEDRISTVQHSRQHSEQKLISVHDHRKDKSKPFSKNGLFPSTIKALQNAAILVK